MGPNYDLLENNLYNLPSASAVFPSNLQVLKLLAEVALSVNCYGVCDSAQWHLLGRCSTHKTHKLNQVWSCLQESMISICIPNSSSG